VERKELLNFLENLKVANKSNSYESLLKYLNNQELLNKISNGEQVSLAEVKEAILEHLSIMSENITVDETISLLKLLVDNSDGYIYRFYFERLGDFPTKIKNMSDTEQLRYVDEILDCTKYTNYNNIITCWKNFSIETQRKSLSKVLKMYSHKPFIIDNILYNTHDIIKNELSFNELKDILQILLSNQNGKEFAELFINSLSNNKIEENLLQIIEFIKNNKLSINNVFSGSNLGFEIYKTRQKIYMTNIIEIIDALNDDINLTEEAIELYFDCIFGDRIMHPRKTITETDVELASLIKRFILSSSKSNNLNDKEKIMNYFRNNSDSNMIIHLWRCDQNLREIFNDDEKIEIYLLLDDINYYFSIDELFSLDFIKNNINKILQKSISNGTAPWNVRKIIKGLPQDICNLIDENIFLYCMNDELFKDKGAWFNFYLSLSDNLKIQYFNKIYTDIMNDSNLYYGSQSRESVIEDLITKTPKQAYEHFTKDEWIKILNLSFDKHALTKYFNYINENIRGELLNSYIEELSKNEDCESITYHLSRLDDNVIRAKMDFILKNGSYNLKLALFHLLDENEINDDIILNILLSSSINNDKVELLKRYNTIKKYNININKTIVPEILCDEIYNEFGIEIILRLSSHIKLQYELLNYRNDSVIIQIIKKICLEKENWLEWLDYGLSKQAFVELKKACTGNYDKITNENIENSIKIAIDKENHFGIFSIEDIENYNTKKFELCMEILINSNACKKLYTTRVEGLYESPRLIQQKFAVCELLFGMDHMCVENLVKKYGKDIQDIEISNFSQEEQDVMQILIQMKNIYESENLEEVILNILNNSKQIFDRLKELKNSIDIEKTLIGIYQKLYEKEIYKVPQIADSVETINVNDNNYNVKIINLKPSDNGFYDFKMFIRSEGAYDPNWNEPNDFNVSINRPEIEYHGNCKSLIANNLLALPKSKGPVFGYNSSRICLSAPWDIVSSSANKSMSIINSNWTLGRGVEYLSPNNMINNTRHTHNEFVSDRLIYNRDKSCYEKEFPNFVIWVQETLKETETEREDNDKWRQTKKAAAQLGIPIVIINREAVIISEQKRLLNNLKRLTSLDTETNVKKIFESIITNFENNVVGLQFAENLKDKFFTDDDRNSIYDIIENALNVYKNSNPEFYYECLYVIKELLEKEINKTRSNKGSKVSKFNRKLSELLRKYESIIDNFEINKKAIATK